MAFDPYRGIERLSQAMMLEPAGLFASGTLRTSGFRQRAAWLLQKSW